MNFQSSSCVERLATVLASVSEAAKEVFGLYMVPDIGPASVGEHAADRANIFVGQLVLYKVLVQVLGLLNFSKLTCTFGLV